MTLSNGQAETLAEHPAFIKAMSDLETAILNAAPGTIIFLVGLSGAGKTWARRMVARRLFSDPSRWPVGKVPYVEVMCLLADRGYHSPKDQASTLFEQLNAPDLRWLYENPMADASPFADAAAESRRLSGLWQEGRRQRTEREFWRSSISIGNDRQLQLVAFEHASLMVKNRVDGTAIQHTLNLMSVATDMGSKFLLTTTPEGYELWAKYPEIDRRMDHVWINPYSVSEPKGKKTFAVLLKKLSRGMTFKPADLLLQAIFAIAEATQTSTGNVCRLLQKAQASATCRGSAAVERVDLRAAFPSPTAVENLKKSAEILRTIQVPFSHPSLEDPSEPAK